MEKTLLKPVTGKTETNENMPVVTSADENKGLATLVQEMQPHLQDAAKDLLQPRQEAIDKLLNKVLH